MSSLPLTASAMKNLTGTLKLIMAGLLLAATAPAFANDDSEYTCEESANRVSSIIDDWYMFIRDVGAEAKNPSVVAMHADHEQGNLVEKFKRQCVDSWKAHEEIYSCFSGVRNEISAAMCMHPDTNKSDWSYQ